MRFDQGIAASSLTNDPADQALAVRLFKLLEQGRRPLISTDMDDTILPFGVAITEKEIDFIVEYAEAGGHLAFNTLAPKEWFYVRVVELLVSGFRARNCAHLLPRVHWITSGGREIFAYDLASGSYRRIHAPSKGTKAEGFAWLGGSLAKDCGILALYGDRFDDPFNDGNAIGVPEIPLIINVGADQLVSPNPAQIFINATEKGPPTTLRHLKFVAGKLRESQARVLPLGDAALPWRADGPSCAGNRINETRYRIQTDRAGFLWSWDDRGTSYLTPFAGGGADPACSASFPDAVVGFTFFWAREPEDPYCWRTPGHWEGRDYFLKRGTSYAAVASTPIVPGVPALRSFSKVNWEITLQV